MPAHPVPTDAKEREGTVSRARALAERPTDEVLREFGSSPNGLSQRQVEDRRATEGWNRIEEIRGPGVLKKLAQQFVHLFALLLWVAAVLSFGIGLSRFGIAIVVVIVLNGIFGLLQEYRAERAVAALKRLLPPIAHVRRDGREQDIPAEDLVPGDVLLLREGDRVSADARLIQAQDLRLDESNLTGESHPTYKAATAEHLSDPTLRPRNLVFAGSSVVAGSAEAVVSATGMGSEFGRIATLTQSVGVEASPLQIEVRRVAVRVALLSIAMGATFFAIGYLGAGLSLRDGAIFAIGIVLANVPEGLLPTMTLALAMGVQRMARRGAIVKRLASVETLGSCTVICTDKTGTITSNAMTARRVWAGGAFARVTGTGYDPSGTFERDGRPLSKDELEGVLPVLRIGHMCNSAHLVGEGKLSSVRGDPTEGALLVAAAKAGLDRDLDVRLRPLVRTLAFDPARKRMSTVHRALPGEGPVVAYVKGAPRELLEQCSAILANGVESPMSSIQRAEVMRANDEMAREGLRVIAMAYRYLPEEAAHVDALQPDAVEHDLVFAGLVGMHDPPRDEVPGAVEKCHQAGLKIIMITGDYGLTAEAIARQVGIVSRGYRVVAAEELDQMSDEALRTLLANGHPIFARATPEHKLRIVMMLRAMGEVVAVTGDGVNDAPALKRADIGVAMGIAGTDVAREASDMVLTDDNFATIVSAIEEGRSIFDNMRKFIVYIFAHLTPEAIPFIFFALFHVPLPITVMQILAIDLGTETLPALALGVERPEPDVMIRPPRRPTERLLDARSLARGYGFLGLMSTAIVLGSFFTFLAARGWHWGQSSAPSSTIGSQASTIVFLGIVILQVGNAFACRTERASALTAGLFSNRFLLLGVGFELGFAAALIYVPALQRVFDTAGVGAHWWFILLAFIPLIFAAEEARKAIARRRAARASMKAI